ncbi:MAG: DNA polymerase [Candidatus Omnitrophota bacterium]
MHNKIYVISLQHPFSSAPFIFIKKGEEIGIYRDCSCFDGPSTYVSYDFSCVIDKFRSEERMSLPRLIDVQTAKKLIVGRKKNEFAPENQPWILKNIIGKYVEPSSIKWLSEFLKLRITPSDIEAHAANFVADIMKGFEKAWSDIEEDLEKANEGERFRMIENPLYNIFLHTQLFGVSVPKEDLLEILNDLYRVHYKSLKRLELEHGFVFNPIDINSKIRFSDIKDFVRYNKIIKEDFEYDFWESVELYSEFDEFLTTLFTAYKSFRDRNALLRYAVDQYDSVYPKFDIMGTVTGRILVTSPGIQYLKKTSRIIFKSKNGYSHLYADFDQFEPGIIASFSKDERLIELYNNGDVYTELSKVLFGSGEKRKIAKIIFLAFIYGMSQTRMEHFIEMIAGEESKIKGMSFFGKFQKLCSWKENVCRVAIQEGHACSFQGNRRYLRKKGEASSSEMRWIPNQIIQGTASYIFKKSLIEVKKAVPYVEFLVPMHDAILFQVPNEEIDNAKRAVKEIFVKEFSIVCPNIKTSVSFENFSEK